MKILVADDEALVRIGLKTVLESSNENYEVIEAGDGQEAFEKFKEFNPPLVFVDINMPKMDGLQFVNAAKKYNKNSRFVVLTCHSDFEHMREAIKIGLSDYIIKTSINNKELASIAAGIEKEMALELDRQNGQAETPGYREIIFENELKKAIENKDYDRVFVEKLLQEKGIGLSFDILVTAEKGLYRKEEPIKGTVSNIILEIVREYGNGLILEYSEGKHIIIKSSGSAKPEGMKSIAEEFCRRLLLCLKDILNRDFSIGICDSMDLNHIYKAVSDAERMLQLGFLKNGSGYYFCDGEPLADADDIGFDQIKQRIENHLRLSEYSNVINLLDDFVNDLANKRINQVDKVIDTFFKIFYLVEQHVESCYCEKKAEIIGGSIDCTYLLRCGDIYSITEIIKVIIFRLSGMSSGMQDNYYEDMIKKAKVYINRNIEKKMSLQDVAEFVNLSPSHFSKVFKDITGDNFIDYCIGIRMEKAKILINEGNKVFVAAENVGYSNYSYFSKLFKKMEGITPEEYKKK